jgi:hypothetical protein
MFYDIRSGEAQSDFSFTLRASGIKANRLMGMLISLALLSMLNSSVNNRRPKQHQLVSGE